MLTHLKLITDHAQAELTSEQIAHIQSKTKAMDMPDFQKHNFDIPALEKQLKPYQKYSNIIIIANGGSRTSALAYWQSLKHLRNHKTIEFISSMEPDVIADIRSRYTTTDTLVMPITKSGTNVDVLEPLLQLLDYPILPVTSPEKGVLYDMAKHYGWEIITHPEVGGRFSGRTECGMSPAILMGLDAQKIDAAAVKAYKSLDYQADPEKNIALQAAAICATHEAKGFDEIFMPVYSKAMAGFLPLTIQLLHESTGKNGKGQSLIGDEGPETQHHTNQRFFGGPKNMLGWFITVAEQRNKKLTLNIPKEIQELPLRDGTLKNLHGIPLQDALQFDYEGVVDTATAANIPHMTLEIAKVTEESIGEYLSFFHFYTVYSALLRDQDPFDQPQVEAAKTLSFAKRKAYKI